MRNSRVRVHGNAWNNGKRLEVATCQVLGMKAPQIEAATGVPATTIRHWRREDWFRELVDEIRTEDDIEIDAKFSKLISRSLDVMNDRLEHGDYQYDPKAGKMIRKPVLARDALRISDTMFDKRNLLRGKPTSITGKEQIGDRLNKLAAEFQRFVSAKTIDGELVDAVHEEREEGLPEGVRQVPLTGEGKEQAGTS